MPRFVEPAPHEKRTLLRERKMSGRTQKVCLAVVFGALLMAAPAGAHLGDIWFTTAAKTSQNIEDKFGSVEIARCQPLPANLRGQYHAHSFVRGSVRVWDHFGCALAITDGTYCVAVAHITGQRWSDFTLTSFPKSGCTPYQLRRR
jgi:hypothetical protein